MNSRAESAQAAMRLGCAALEAADYPGAVRWLERAHRLMPDDPTLTLLLASALSAADPVRAERLLLASATRHPGHRPTQVALAAAAMRRNAASEAAARLHAVLSRGAPPPGEAFAGLAGRIVAESGAAGWIGLSATGTLLVFGPRVRVLAGGTPLRLQGGRGGLRTATLPPGWQQLASIAASGRAGKLIGSPIDVASVLHVQGCITARTDGTASGWAWHPNDPESPVRLDLVAAGAKRRAVPVATVLADQPAPPLPSGDGVERRCGFSIDLAGLPVMPGRAWELRGDDGRVLPGGPVSRAVGDAAATRMAARGLSAAGGAADRWRPLPADLADAASPPHVAARPARIGGIDVILALRGDPARLAACLHSLQDRRIRILAVDGGEAGADLRQLVADAGGLCVTASGSGPALLNAGLRHTLAAKPRHAVLLGSACVLPAEFAGQVEATFRDHPEAGVAEPVLLAPPGLECASTVPLRVTGGPCLAIRHQCLRQAGLLRGDAYATAAAALTDLAMRARHLGWHAVLMAGCRIGDAPMNAADPVQAALEARDRITLERLHPGIGAVIAEQQRADPGFEARRSAAMAVWAGAGRRDASVVLVSHAAGGGVERYIRHRIAAVQAAAGRAIVIRPGEAACGTPLWRVSDGPEATHPDLAFRAPDEFEHMVELLRGDRPSLIELHHSESHPAAISGLAPALGIPYDVVVHDFAMICPRVTFVAGGRYCGEPVDATECDECIADHGWRIGDGGPVGELRGRSAALAAGARRVIAPTADTARRLRRQLHGLLGDAGARIVHPPLVPAWEDDAAVAASVPRQPGRAAGARHAAPVTVCAAGAIGTDKGFEVLLACARDSARRKLNLTFTVVGHTIDDERLLDTGRVFITGEYEEQEAVALIRAQQADIGFVPSIWPETWCYTLSALWQAGLWTVAFALGAPAERIAATGAGRIVPLGMPAARLNDLFINLIPTMIPAAAHG